MDELKMYCNKCQSRKVFERRKGAPSVAHKHECADCGMLK